MKGITNQPPIVLHLALDHEDCVYRAQRWIKGTVTMKRHESSSPLWKNGNKETTPQQQPQQLSISLVGKEQTWTTPTLRDSCRRRNEDEVVFLEDEQVLHDKQEEEEDELHGLTSTTTTYPFSIFLPGSLAPSMYLEVDDENGHPRGCSVTYELTAWYGTLVTSVTKSVHIVGPTLSSKTHPYHSLMPLPWSDDNDDDTHLTVQIENTHVPKGGSLPISLSLSNSSSSNGAWNQQPIQVNVQVMEEIHWTTHVEKKQHSYTHILSEQRNVTLLPACCNNDDDDSSSDRMDSSSASPRVISLPIPSTARDTYFGTKRIQVTHALCLCWSRRGGGEEQHQHTIPLVICDPPLNSHHHHRSLSKESLHDIITTVWPGDVIVPETNTNDASEHSSCPRILEEEDDE